MSNSKYDVKSIICSVFLLAIILSDVICKYISRFSYFDEFVAILFGIGFIFGISKSGIRKSALKIVSCVIVLVIIGLLGNSFSGLTIPTKYIIFDMFNVFKYLFVVLGANYIYRGIKKDSVLKIIAPVLGLIIIISTVFMIINLFSNIGMHTDYRYGIRAYNFIFSRVGAFYSALILFDLVFAAYLFYNGGSRFIKACIILTQINMLSTLRIRAFIFVILYLSLYYWFIVKGKFTVKKWYIIPFAFLFYLISRDQFFYYFSGTRARNILLKYGIVTANNYFPLGSGFATYGTAIAQKNYSPLYYVYNFGNYWGLSSDYGSFLTDNYWPAIIGEFGYIGAIVSFILIVLVIKSSLINVNNNYSKLCVCFGFATLVVSSFATSSIFAATRVMVLITFCSTLIDYSNQSKAKIEMERQIV